MTTEPSGPRDLRSGAEGSSGSSCPEDCLKTEFAGVSFKNPVVLASGTCGFGREYNEIFDIQLLGGLASKGLTLNPRPGNEGIRVWETASGVMNSVGLENPGVRGFIEKEFDWLNSLDIVNIVNLGGHSIEDYIEGVELLNGVELDILELNISCPNVKAGGMAFGIKTELAREVVRKIRAVCKHKLVVKLSPNAEDIVALARACEEEGADGISLVNTFLAMGIDIQKRTPVFQNTYAGLSGPAIKPIALRMTHQAAKAVHIPVMGMGGITTWQDAVEFIMAGAAVVQIGTGNFMDPTLALDVIEGMRAYLVSQKMANIAEIRGCV
ncbi:MAG: dihydroorotate dehydrogenase [Synergistaceae bacterium]|jgi:dihydroorotate dehydrogenase (NAD+) catalytic subunit|nr:dihydroorotate dehydrogenase [Synergistaceae bacterium]